MPDEVLSVEEYRARMKVPNPDYRRTAPEQSNVRQAPAIAEPNLTERIYFEQKIEPYLAAGLGRDLPPERAIAWYGYEALKIILTARGRRVTYTPDYWLVFADGHHEVHEVKGHWEDDARVKFKVAADAIPWARFQAAKPVWGKLRGKRQVVGWDIEVLS